MPTYNGNNNDNTLKGSRRNDIINGNGGNDHLDGRDGDDILNGGAGDDYLAGGNGFDRLYGGAGNDTLTEWTDNSQDDIFDGGEGNDTFLIAGTKLEQFDYHLNLETETDQYDNTYINIENVISGSGDDKLTGSEVANILEGRAGDDVIIGGSFSQEQVEKIGDATTGTRDEIGDVIGNSDGSSLDTTSPGDADTLLGGTGDDLLLGGRGDDAIEGGTGDDVMYGNSGNDKMSGDDGDDTMYGGKGNDRISDGAGNDTVLGDSGDDYVQAGERGKDNYNGGSGNDTLDYSQNSQSGSNGLKIDLSKGTVTGSGHKDSVKGFETVIGSNGKDKIKGSKNDETIDGAGGNDWIRGYKGADTLTGGDGADTFFWERKDVDDMDTITDFDMSSDTLDFRKLIKSTKYDETSDVVRVEQTDEGSVVSVYSGSDYGWQTVALLEDVYTDADQLFNDGLMLL